MTTDWKTAHDNLAARNALLRQRHDLPVDRIPAHAELARLQEENARLRAKPEGEAPQAAAPGALDADELTRLRRLLAALGHADAFELSDEYVRGELCHVLGLAAGKLERAALAAVLSAPGTPEALADDRKGIELWRATLRACGELPEGYEVRIELENGCGMAVWYDAEGERHVIDGDGYLSSDVNEAVDAAIERAAQLDGGQEGSGS